MKHEIRRSGDYLSGSELSLRQKLAISCRYLAIEGHESGLAGQITARIAEGPEVLAPPVHLMFSETSAKDFVHVDADFNAVDSDNKPNPATRFHLWVYNRRPEVQCVVHTHPPYTSALSMLGRPLVVSHMDAAPFFNDCAFLAEWPGVPVADKEGEIISDALGDKRAILLSHHGMLTTGQTIEEALFLAVFFERAAKIQLLAEAAGTIVPIPDEHAAEAHDFLLQPSITSLSFDAWARMVLKDAPECLDE